MGSYTDLSVGGYPILETKSAVVPEAMTIFRETDKRLFTRKISERNELARISHQSSQRSGKRGHGGL